MREVFGNFPLPSHNWAAAAARRGICIAQQDQEAFWRFHDLLLSTQSAITSESLATITAQFAASDRRLDSAKYEECMAGNHPDSRLNADLAACCLLDIHSSPVVFLNGRRYEGFPDEAALSNAIKLAVGESAEPAKEIDK